MDVIKLPNNTCPKGGKFIAYAGLTPEKAAEYYKHKHGQEPQVVYQGGSDLLKWCFIPYPGEPNDR